MKNKFLLEKKVRHKNLYPNRKYLLSILRGAIEMFRDFEYSPRTDNSTNFSLGCIIEHRLGINVPRSELFAGL